MVDEFRPLTLAHRALTRSKIRIYSTDYMLADLDQEELNIFNAQFPTLLAPPTSVARAIQLDRVETYVIAIRAIKKQLNDVAFRGLNPEDTELGFQPIRPQFTHDPVTSTYRANWFQALLAAAWTNFLGDGVGAYPLGDDFGIIATHLTSLITPTPFVSEIQMNVGKSQLVPVAVRAIEIGANENGVAVYPIPSALLLPKSTWHMQIMADSAGTDNLEVGGLAIGLGRVLKETAASW